MIRQELAPLLGWPFILESSIPFGDYSDSTAYNSNFGRRANIIVREKEITLCVAAYVFLT
jgi:hypothetical protein